MAMASRLIASKHVSLLRPFSSSSSSSPPSPPSFRSLKSAIKSEQDPLKLTTLFESSIPTPTFTRHRPLFTLTVHKLSKSKRPDLVHRILTNSITHSPPQHLSSEGFWLRVVMLYSQAGMVDNALKVFDEMVERKKCEVTEKSLCGVLSVMLDNKIYGDDERFMKTYESFVERTGVSPGVKAFNLVVKGYVKAGKVDEAREMVSEMGSKGDGGGVKVDIGSYNVILGGYLGSGKKSAFDAVVKEIGEKGLEGNLVTYNHRILRYCKSKEVVRAKKLLDEMISKGVEPDSSSYNAIIFGFCKVGDFESARNVLEKMVSDGYVKAPSFGYYTLMKFMVEEGEFDGGLKICKDIIQKKWVPPFEATKLLVNGLVKDSKADEAKEIVGSFKSRLRGSALESWGKIEATLPI